MNYKAIIIGSQLSGKTTLVRHLRSVSDLNLLEMDEEIMRLNNNIWPDNKTKDEVLTPRICADISGRENIVFLTNYFVPNLLRTAKGNGFKIIELKLDKKTLLERNETRIKDEGYDDASQWIDGHLDFIKSVEELGLLDSIIDAKKPVSEIAEDLLSSLNK